ncbi:hypothetical protein SMACR_09355 [Sordaria macrospora]|uniref:WGS project CABT00000000 data, contig 2.87 n=2 Tax=Sordaria macrospora TaxID=5147 RepID=F7WBW9_SORMK|nr:uncharacterized protein SMAC_09355 [Sordaria macrospora k-hell]KAA8624110.1 hypothetical protein SMACR_09355 [Sordaria macrospora]WPJ66153.1 hypothetical protein SMAC4_09355 [Sordaria macrospora]CCC14498.1 unnamed protein product [Sordaria macrospora k-hell]
MWPPTRRESPDAMQVNGPSSLPVSSSWVERAKVHRALFEFINWVARMGAKKPVSSKIKSLPVRLLQELLEAQGRPKPERQSLDDNTLCSRVYETQEADAQHHKDRSSSSDSEGDGNPGHSTWALRPAYSPQ